MSSNQISELQQFSIDIQNASQKASAIITEETARYVKEKHNYHSSVDYDKAHIKSRYEYEAEFLAELGYRKSAAVALEEVDRFQCELRHIFLVMCNGEDYNTLNLLQIDSAIESLFDDKCAELKKKYTEGRG